MARFIDAEKYPCKTCGISYCNENCKKFYEWLNGCDYNVEKVVEQIREKSFNSGHKAPITKIGTLNAIEIVRKGGVE